MSKERPASRLYQFGPFCVDATERVLLRHGEPLMLPPKIFETLLALVERSGHIVEKNDLMEAVWPDTFVEESNLASNVSHLRKTLGEGADGKPYIETVPRRGYRFTAEVREITDEAAEVIVRKRARARVITREEITDAPDETQPSAALPPVEAVTIAGPQALTTTAAQVSRPSWWPNKTALLMAALFLVAASIFSYFWLARRAQQPAQPTELKSLAILPLKEIGAVEARDPSPEMKDPYLGLGVADALITKFGNLRQIVVRPTSAVRKYAAASQDSVAAGRELGVEAVLEGSLQRAGERIRVTVRLLRVSDAAMLWAESFDDKFTDLLTVQDSISEKVLGALKLKLSGEERALFRKHYTDNTEAYQAYLKGRYFWNKRDAEGFKKAIEYFQQATDVDPNYALAYSGVADCYNLLPGYAGLAPGEAFPKAKAAAQRALALDDTLAEAHASLGFALLAYDYDWQGAEREYRRALQLNPNYATAHQWYGMLLYRVARFEEAIAEIRRAQELDPLSSSISVSLGVCFYYARRYDESIEQYRKILDLDPNFVPARYQLGRTFKAKGLHAEAIAEYAKARELAKGNPVTLVGLGQAYAKAGQREQALKTLAELKEPIEQNRIMPYDIAIIYANLGEVDEALAWLERAAVVRDVNMTYLKVEPELDSLRSDPRFNDLLRRVGLTTQ